MSEEKSGDEVSLLELYNLALRYKKSILASPIIFGLLAFIWVNFVISPSWEASAVLEVGHVAGAPDNKPIEPVVNVVARMQMPSFPSDVLKNEGMSPNDPRRFVGALKVNKMKEAELIEAKVRAPSREMALAQLKADIAWVQKVHFSMIQNTVLMQKRSLEILTDNIQSEKTELEAIRKKLFDHHEWNSFDATLMAIVWKDKSAELKTMIDKKLGLEAMMSSEGTYTTRVLGEVGVTDEPVSPRKFLIIGVAILLGLLAGMVFAFVHNAVTPQSSR